jgi:dipeptidyl aminopeptidase/acylaminoacyl peptidase
MELAEDALDAVDLLVEEALVDPARVGLVGFSQGGWIAPLAANRSTNVSFVVTVSGSVATPRRPYTPGAYGRSRWRLPEHRHVVELEVEGEPIEVLLGPSPTAIARLSTAPDAQIAAPRPVMSDMVVGQPFDDAALDLVAGDPLLLSAFTNAMRAPFKQLG